MKELLKKLIFRYTRLGRPNYPYCIEPIQIATLINEIERLKGIQGNIVEIGVARGMTTRLICQHLINENIDNNQTLFCLDTFSSFTPGDLQFEIEKRGKTRQELLGFDYNDYEIWKKNFSQFPFVEPIQTDAAAFDYRKISPIKLAFLDVDLYLPTTKALPKIYEQLVKGGVILVDDIQDKCMWDGAYHAYMEFCHSKGMLPRITGNKCGLIYKNVEQN
jgi:O-methyltransferase